MKNLITLSETQKQDLIEKYNQKEIPYLIGCINGKMEAIRTIELSKETILNQAEIVEIIMEIIFNKYMELKYNEIKK